LAAAALQALLSKTRGPSDKLFSISYHTLCNNLRRDQRKAGIPQANFVTPHCFRHGGASFWNAMAVPIDDIVARGRWASPKSAKTYIQTGSALVFSERLPPAVRDISDRLARRPMVLLDSFPVFDSARLGPLGPPYFL
jgi:integrase